ncbi:phosphatidylserine decarboxylase [Helicobacter mastomyrinus]|uniref:Phosphatidylserine decarboxylase n=1 Tax=Helicobacter mastomyrinus TaxID=287948 RepID=A0ABZ3F455_9HELI
MTTTQIIAKQGWIGALVLLGAFLLTLWFDWNLCAFVLFVLLVLWLIMFRNPERIPNINESNAFTSPVDGIIRDIQSIEGEINILIETRFIDVGVIRAPYDVVKGECQEKRGLSLTCCAKDKTNLLNASMSFQSLEDRKFTLDFYPIFFSSHHIFASSDLNVGERIGFMKAGMTRINIPQQKGLNAAEVELKVSIGDRVKALQSVIGYFYEV